jgi:FKBP-type peptidyl-prolyl cis-trans isomerase
MSSRWWWALAGAGLLTLPLLAINPLSLLAQEPKAAEPKAADPAKKAEPKSIDADLAEIEKGSGMTSLRGKAGYIVGHSMGQRLKQMQANVDLECLLMGVKDALAGKTAMPEAELEAAGAEFQKYLMAKRQKADAELKKAGIDFLAANKTKEGVKTTASGLQYKVVKAGAGKMPKATDTVSVHYAGRLVDGTEFDSSIKRGKPAQFPVGGVIAGWSEALQLMPVGSKWELYIPSDLAYGPQGSPPVIPADAVLVFEVELLNIEMAKGLLPKGFND